MSDKKASPAAVPGSSSEQKGGKSSKKGAVPLKNPTVLERLRERIEGTVHELERLRQENTALHERVRTLEATMAKQEASATLRFDEDPVLLRRKVEGFIQTIDSYLAKEAQQP